MLEQELVSYFETHGLPDLVAHAKVIAEVVEDSAWLFETKDDSRQSGMDYGYDLGRDSGYDDGLQDGRDY